MGMRAGGAPAEKQMRKCSTLFVLNLMILSGTAAVGIVWSGVVLASDKCQTEPDPQSPQGSHWYYHTDRESHRKCWYLGRPEVKVPQAVARESSSPQPKSDARITRNLEADNEVSHQLDETAREALFQEFLRWQERQNRSQSSSGETNRDALFREFVLWQVRHMDADRAP
jgi:hypothetical protein